MTGVTTLLAGIKTRALIAGSASVAFNGDSLDQDYIRALETSHEDVPRLVAALEAVAGLHTPFMWDFGFGPVTSCKGCADQGASELAAAYPCPTITAVVAALGGGE